MTCELKVINSFWRMIAEVVLFHRFALQILFLSEILSIVNVFIQRSYRTYMNLSKVCRAFQMIPLVAIVNVRRQ